MSRQTPHERVVIGPALIPANVGNSAVNGPAISSPWKIGRYISFLLVAGAMTTNDALTIKVQSQDAAGTWSDVTEADGTTTLQFTAANTADGGSLESGSLLGTIDLSRFDFPTTDAKAVRLSAINAVAQNVLLSAVYQISDLYTLPGSQADDLLSKALWV